MTGDYRAIRRVTVTGGAGFIGANLCRRLCAEGHDVRVIDDLSTGHPGNLAGLDTELINASILDESAVARALKGADAVVHLAARPSVPRSLADPLATHTANATGTAMVLEAARTVGVNHVIVASSSSVYGANSASLKTEDLVPRPLSPYAASKLATESYALAWAESFGLEVLAFRFFNVFGPLQRAGHAYAAVIPAFLSAALQGRKLPVHGDGLQTRDFTFVESVTSVIGDAIERRVAHGSPVNLAFGTRHSLIELIGTIEALVGRSLPIDYLEPRRGDVRHSRADQTLLRALFPAATPVPLDRGLRDTLAWLAGDNRG